VSIDEFITSAPSLLLAFKAACLREAEHDQTFNQSRDEADWAREFAAYMTYVELEEKFKQE